MDAPNREDFLKGCEEFVKHEKRDAMYKVASFLISHLWGQPSNMADGLGVLLLTWNQAFYRYGSFDFDDLENCITANIGKIEHFRNKSIFDLSEDDEGKIKDLFNSFLDALKIHSGKKKDARSPVAVAKALHLLAPNYFPLWDDKIAREYGCYYNLNPAEKYVVFCRIIRGVAKQVKDFIPNSEKTIVKLIDEYNYAKHTKGWI